MNLEILGWSDQWQKAFAPHILLNYVPARVASEYKGLYRLLYSGGEVWGQVSGKLRHTACSRGDFPAVGDWVLVALEVSSSRAIIHMILPRKSKFSRKQAGQITDEQVVAANVDHIFIVTALNKDFNTRRIERYLTLVWESGANPVIVLSKADLAGELEKKLQEVHQAAVGVPVHVVSSLTGEGIEALKSYLWPSNTVALLGSSGAGKSSLINRLLGAERQKVSQTREDDKGRHTTTNRELVVLPAGGLIIDTPGMRELQLWNADAGLSQTFEDIENLERQCRFSNCQHQGEPGCAIEAALAAGTLDGERYNSFLKLRKELAYLSRRQNIQEELANKEKWKKIHKDMRHNKKK